MASRASSWPSIKLRNLAQFFFFRSQFKGQQHRDVVAGYSVYQGLQLINANRNFFTKFDCNMVKDGKNKVQGGQGQPSAGFNFSLWAKWMLGSMVSLLLPFWKQNWAKFQKIEGETEVIVEEIEYVAEVVEKVANVADHISTQMADKLPSNGKLKEAVLLVQHVSEVAAHDAQLTQNFIHKVDELKQDLDDLETMVDKVKL